MVRRGMPFFGSLCRAGVLRVAAVALTVFFLAALPVRQAWAEGVSPCLNQGAKWRIAYYEGGPWADYESSLRATVQALMDMGWIEPAPLPRCRGGAGTTALWKWLSTEAKSDYLVFPRDGFLSAHWEDGLRRENRDLMLGLLAQERYDLVWALGSWAGLDLVNNDHRVPTMVMSTSSPVTAGIIPHVGDSGYDHVHVRTDPTCVLRQILLFHDIFKFSRMGLIYEETVHGRAYAYLNEMKAAARLGGFELVTCQAPNANSPMDTVLAMQKYVACARKLAPEVNAFVYDDHTGAMPSHVGQTLPIFARFRVPTWSTRGPDLVERGVLMSIAEGDFDQVGRFYAQTMAQILNGARPRDLDQIFDSHFRLAINMKTAEFIGYDPPPELVDTAGSVVNTIDPPWEPEAGQ